MTKKPKDDSKVLPDSIPANPQPIPRRKTFVEREVEVPLTDEEKAKLSKQLVEALEGLEDAEDRKAEVTSQFAGEIKTYKAAYKSLVRALRRGFAMRTVRCKWEFNKPKEGLKQLINPETTKVVETAQMSEFEKQESLFPEEDSEKTNEEKPKTEKHKVDDKPLASSEKGPVM